MMIGSLKIPGPGYDLQVDAQFDMPTEDISGNSDSTEKADKGVKPQTLTVSFCLRSTVAADVSYLTLFKNLAQAKDSAGEAIPYIIIHPLAQALDIRQARFVGTVSVSQDQVLRQWRISCTLSEVKSVPEESAARTQQRTNGASPASSFEEALQKIEAQTK